MIPVKKISLVTTFLLISLLSSSLEGTERTDQQKQFDFAESLFADGDYYRAITEYKRFIFYYPQEKTLIEKSSFRIGESYFKAGRWKEAVNEFSFFNKDYPQSAVRHAGHYLKGISEMQLKLFNNALATFNDIITDTSNTYYDKAIYQIGLIRLEKREWQMAKDAFSRIPKDSSLLSSANIMSSSLDRVDEVSQKTPFIAGTLAALLPGAGHLYTERPKDAAVSFLLNGSFIWTAVELFDHKHYAAASIIAFFELGWYSGNIFSAVNSAHKHNRNAEDKFIENLKEKSSISYYFNPDTHANYVKFSMKF